MDAIPPSYEAATSRNPLPLIAPYLRRRDLLNANRVCREWHTVFSEVIWSCPERMWKLDGRSGFNGFLHFLRVLNRLPQKSRRWTTHYTKSLSFHSAPSSIYTVFEPTWLSALLSNLPYLEVLNVSNASYFDHESLRSFAQSSPPVCTHTLTTFIAHGCQNTTSSSIDLFLRVGWPALEHLDLSKSAGVCQPKVLFTIAHGRTFPNLKRLVLRDMELKDSAIQTIAKGMGTRLEMLDIRGNLVTDTGVLELLNYCFLPPDYDISPTGDGAGKGHLAPPPSFKDSSSGSGSGTDLPSSGGISRLLISGNPKISWRSIESLIKTTRLVNFDCGMVADLDRSAIPNARIPTFVLSVYGYKHLRSLRIDYRLISPPGITVKRSRGGREEEGEGKEKDRLRPEMMPNLKTLVLCGTPFYARPSTRIVENILRFLEDLAEAEQQAKKKEPLNSRFKGLYYLKMLVFEMQSLTVSEQGGDAELGMYASSSAKVGDTADSSDDDDEDEDEDDDEDDFADKLQGDFSFFTEGENEGTGGDWREKAHGLRGKKKEKPLSVLAELQRYREAGRKGRTNYWGGEVKVFRDVGWDDDGGVESGSIGRLKWGLVIDQM
ncbi:hypothetical protein DFH27DRAFT_552104 [Peziza echinospora]|nr:hypothetical protein DFH27DRAFT_552104 [Peziza echinospora]